MLEEDLAEISSYHICGRRGCTRAFCDSIGDLDFFEGQFDNSRPSVQKCPQCQSVLYLAEADRSKKIETWECQTDCDFSEEHSSPSAR